MQTAPRVALVTGASSGIGRATALALVGAGFAAVGMSRNAANAEPLVGVTFVLAPWLRGYAPSPTAGPFDFAALTGDVLALIDRWSPRRAVELGGHEWGALITCDACVTAPERIERAVTLAIPHPFTFLSRSRLAQLRRSWCMGLFQLPGSGRMATSRDLALIDRLWRQWSPGLSLDPALQAELHEHLRASMPAPIKYYRVTMRPGMLRAGWRSSPTSVTSCTSRPPRRSRHGPSSGSLDPRGESTGMYGAERALTWRCRGRRDGADLRGRSRRISSFSSIAPPGASPPSISAWAPSATMNACPDALGHRQHCRGIWSGTRHGAPAPAGRLGPSARDPPSSA
ncbi:alpha/beta hydrolase [Streptomyces griseiscabiei]|uniref:alpha/beta hydrolase n=1 Tax=Streptomyces griseiscabiei TaxID=2993540 RepID=UPI0037D9B59F